RRFDGPASLSPGTPFGRLPFGLIGYIAKVERNMSDPYFQKLFADRVGGANYGKGTAIYKFEKIKRAKRKALADHPERMLIDFGIGKNDEMAPLSVRKTMGEEINRLENRGYS